MRPVLGPRCKPIKKEEAYKAATTYQWRKTLKSCGGVQTRKELSEQRQRTPRRIAEDPFEVCNIFHLFTNSKGKVVHFLHFTILFGWLEL